MKNVFGNRPLPLLPLLCTLLVFRVQAQLPQLSVAIHDSELTRALESMPASPPTPTGSGTTGFQWWPTDWHYFTLPEAAKELLRSDGTPFTVVSDANISAGQLLNNGAPRYPIMISLASEAIRNDEIAQLTNYVAAGGFLIVGSSSFTRNTNGTSRGDFAIGNELGLHLATAGLNNWTANSSFTKQGNHRLTAHFPGGQLTLRQPSSSEEIPWGISPSHPFLAPHDVWRVQTAGATVLANGDSSPFLTIRQYGKGYFIYCSAFQPLIGHGGFAPGMYSYVIFKKAIEWAFETFNQPVGRLSPWPFPYDAAFMVRHDLENYTNEIANIEASAQFEFNNKAKGDYYFCTGTLRVDASPTYNTNNLVASLRRAVANYGATIGPHNGGLKNPNNNSLVRGQYDYWHWGPDEALDITPPGYSSGKAYAFTSISNSFRDIESWLSGLTNGARSWVACYFNATRDDSYDIQAKLNVKITGDQKIGPFPHWTFSTKTPGVRYPFLTQPVSDWYVGGLVAQSLEPWHPPGVHSSQTLHAAIDFYYNLGGLINIYSHTMSTGLGDAGQLVPDYITYSLNTNLHPRMWSANALLVYQWWQQRSNVQVSASFATNGVQSVATLSISGATHADTTVELLLPGTNAYCGFQVFTNGNLAAPSTYRINGQLLKLRVGRFVTNAVVSYSPLGPVAQIFSQNFDSVTAPALPAGWTASASGAQPPWLTQTTVRDTTPNAAFVPDATNIGQSDLVSTTIAIPAGSALLTFRNNYDLEAGSGSQGFDGGVLEIKIGTNVFQDIVAAGGSFVSGGYNSSISPSSGNLIGGRAAWSGTSSGFITTSVNLPAAASGQNIQLRWRCGTDNSDGRTGWRIDTVSISANSCLCCGGPGTNTAPILPTQANRTIVAQTTLTVINTAVDLDIPTQILSYQLLSPPAGATIDANGNITWTPANASTNTLTTVVTDSGSPPLSATNSFLVVVTVPNLAPVLPGQADRTMAELTALSVSNTASDPDGPANGLIYTLLAAPASASISGSGVINWTPSEGQGPSTNTFTTRVTDSGTPPMSATNTFRVTVTEVNQAPSLPFQPDRTIAELTLLTVTNTAADSDLPANVLTYSFLAAPAGAAISANGVITWTPTEAQGPGTNAFVIRIADNGSPGLSATNGFTVVVTETNNAPVLPAQTNRSVIELTTLVVTNTAADSDVPADSLTYLLVNPPSGAAIETNGVITWTPTGAQGPGTNVLITIVTDNGAPPRSATNSFTVFVVDTNTPPVITGQPASRTNSAGTTATFTVTATGASLSYQWFKGAASLPTGTAATLTLSSVTTGDVGGYSAVVSNPYGSVTSSVATLTVIEPPAIVTQPTSRTNNAGTTATFNVSVTGTSPGFQWIKNGTINLSNGGNVSGATSANLSLANVSASDAGNYSVRVTNIVGSVTSVTAVLTVIASTNSPGQLFADDFTRGTDPGPLSPWVSQSGTWAVTGGLLRGGTNTLRTYANLYVTNNWTNFSAQAQVRFPAGGYGGGLGACVNRTSGAHYGAWIYPEGSSGGSSVLKLVKFQTWTSWAYNGASFTPMQQAALPSGGIL